MVARTLPDPKNMVGGCGGVEGGPEQTEHLLRTNLGLPPPRAHGVVVSHPLSMREALGSIPSVSMLRADARWGL